LFEDVFFRIILALADFLTKCSKGLAHVVLDIWSGNAESEQVEEETDVKPSGSKRKLRITSIGNNKSTFF
jgi:hypothetical protein